MSSNLFEAHNRILKKIYGRTCSKETFKNFVNYCRSGIEEGGVKPKLNPINLYAYGMGLTSEEASVIAFRKEK